MTVKVLEIYLEVILWKPFKLFRRILNDVSSRPFNADFSRGGGNGQESAGDRSGGYGRCSSVVTLFFNKKSLTKTDRCAGTLSWRRNQLFFSIFWGFSSWPDPFGAEGFYCTFLYLQFYNFPHAEILVIVPAKSGKFLKLLHIIIIIGIIIENIVWFCLMQIGGCTLSWAWIMSYVRSTSCDD